MTPAKEIDGELWVKASDMQRAAAEAVKAEREECAQIAKQWDTDHPSTNFGGCIANLIRSRNV